jgi:hypothetical protein
MTNLPQSFPLYPADPDTTEKAGVCYHRYHCIMPVLLAYHSDGSVELPNK